MVDVFITLAGEFFFVLDQSDLPGPGKVAVKWLEVIVHLEILSWKLCRWKATCLNCLSPHQKLPSEDCDFQFYTFCLFFKREKHGYWRSEPNSRMFSWTMIKHLFICSCHWHVFVVSCRRRSSTSSKSSSRAWPNCGRPWWTRPSTCFSSKWRLNWNRLKTNWSRPKMNWVPGNLHLIGKDNQNNPPQKNKTKQKSQDFLTPPTPTLTADMQEQWWGGRLTKCCTHHEIQTLQKASHSQKNQTNPKLFLYSCTVPATYHIT